MTQATPSSFSQQQTEKNRKRTSPSHRLSLSLIPSPLPLLLSRSLCVTERVSARLQFVGLCLPHQATTAVLLLCLSVSLFRCRTCWCFRGPRRRRRINSTPALPVGVCSWPLSYCYCALPDRLFSSSPSSPPSSLPPAVPFASTTTTTSRSRCVVRPRLPV